MKRLVLLAIICLPGVACDLDSLFSDAADAAEKKAQSEKQAGTRKQGDADAGAPAATDEATQNLPGPMAECIAACDADTELSVTDRATCRLNCEQQGESPVATAGESALRKFAVCGDGCEAKSTTDAETCRLNCASQTAGELAAEAQNASAEFRTCSGACLEDMTACRTGCGAKDEAATCRVQCESEGQHCVGSCRR